jgi:hypothetical protein
MSDPQSAAKPSALVDQNTSPSNPVPRLWSDIAADACPVFGGLGWIGLGLVLDPCDQSEQLARYFAALLNLILLGVIGGLSTVLLLLGLYWSRGTERRSGFRATRLGKAASMAGLVIGAVVLLMHLPNVLRHLD